MAETVRLGQDYYLGRSMWLMSLCLLTYDFLLTFNQEVKHFWNGRRGMIRWLFLLNRYWPLANLIFDNIVLAWIRPSPSLCSPWFQFLGYSYLLTHFSIGGILVLRLYALFDCNRILLAILVVLLGTELISETLIIGMASPHWAVTQLPSSFTGCFPSNPQHNVWLYWIPMALYESLLFILALSQLLKGALSSASSKPVASRLMTVLLRDSIVYFGGTLAVILTNLCVWALARPSLFSAFLGFGFCFHSIVGCRMLLNIRESSDRSRHMVDIETIPVTAIRFHSLASGSQPLPAHSF